MRCTPSSPFRLAALMLAVACGSVWGGEKIRFSGKGDPQGRGDAAPARRTFAAPNFLDATPPRSDPLAEITPPTTTPTDDDDRRKEKLKEREEEKRLRFENPDDSDRRKERESLAARRWDQQSRVHGFSGPTNQFQRATNRFRMERETASFASTNQNSYAISRGGETGAQSLPGSPPPASGMTGAPDLMPGGLQIEWLTRGGGDNTRLGNSPTLRLNWSGAPGASGVSFSAGSMPSYLSGTGPGVPTPRPGGDLLEVGGRGGAPAAGLGGGPLGLPARAGGPDNVGVPSGFGGGAPAPEPERPKFEPKPAVLEFPKRKI
jgi:hypothetical protein